MDAHLIKERFSSIWKVKDKRKFHLYILSALIVVAGLVGFSIFRYEVDKRAGTKFNLATSYYREAQNSEDEEERLTRYQKVKSLYEAILSRYPLTRKKREVLYYLGNCLYSLGEYKEAGQILQKFCGKYRGDYFFLWAKMKIALAYEQQAEYEKTLRCYEEILREYPDSTPIPEVILGMARCYELQKRWDEALAKYEELLSRYPLSEEAAMGEVQIQRLRGKGKVARLTK